LVLLVQRIIEKLSEQYCNPSEKDANVLERIEYLHVGYLDSAVGIYVPYARIMFKVN